MARILEPSACTALILGFAARTTRSVLSFAFGRQQLHCDTVAIRSFRATTCEQQQQHQQRLLTSTTVTASLASSQTNSTGDDKPSETGLFDTTYHAPVMWKECVSALLGCERAKTRNNVATTTPATVQIDQPGEEQSSPLIFIDGTLGGGGHSAALLKNLQVGDVVIGCDVDSTALKTASERLSDYLGSQHDSLPLFVPVQSNFCELASLLPTLSHPVHPGLPLLGKDGLVDGILLDLGVSSHQFDTPERGFAFMKDGPLDMRMNNDRASSFTAADILNQFDERDLRQIIKVYGDEPRAHHLAQAIVQHRPMRTTQDLVKAVATVTPEFSKKSRRLGRMATLARVFQAIRITVNEEDKVLERALQEMCPALLRPGGRLAVLSYHSIEDRATKRMIRDGVVSDRVAGARRGQEKDLYGNSLGPPLPFKSLSKPIKATDEEVEQNSRARSATLRVAERRGKEKL